MAKRRGRLPKQTPTAKPWDDEDLNELFPDEMITEPILPSMRHLDYEALGQFKAKRHSKTYVVRMAMLIAEAAENAHYAPSFETEAYWRGVLFGLQTGLSELGVAPLPEKK